MISIVKVKPYILYRKGLKNCLLPLFLQRCEKGIIIYTDSDVISLAGHQGTVTN